MVTCNWLKSKESQIDSLRPISWTVSFQSQMKVIAILLNKKYIVLVLGLTYFNSFWSLLDIEYKTSVKTAYFI